MTRLSVNINKIATLRNSRGGDIPNVNEAALRCQEFGAQGITVHPRPDQRHITQKDAMELRTAVTTEYNIEGYPSNEFIDLVLKIKPEQVTLVPDAPDALTSNQGWDTLKHKNYLLEIISEFHTHNIRTSIFVETDLKNLEGARKTGTDRIEFYTEPYAKNFPSNKELAIKPFIVAAEKAVELGLGINAGHDLNLQNLNYFYKNIPSLLEVSIGHALIADALYLGLEKTIQCYLSQLK